MIHQRESIQHLAAAIAADPRERAALSRIPVAVAVPPKRYRRNAKSAVAIEMRRLLDQDPELAAVGNDVLRCKDRSEYFVRLRARAIRLLHPHFNDVLIGRFLNRDHSSIKHMRRTRP
jgi:hypothetical protein